MFEITGEEIALLGDEDLRTLIGRLVESDLKKQGRELAGVNYGGDQNAPDGGLDVYVEMHGEENDDAFVPRQITGFQVKVPNMTPAEIKKEMCPGGILRTCIKDIAEKKGAYIIACSTGSVSYSSLRKKIEAMEAVIIECNNAKRMIVDFYDRNKIATWVMQYPETLLWVREKIGKAISGWKSYEDWSSNPQEEGAEFFFDETPCMYEAGKTKERFNVIEGINKIRIELKKDKGCVRLVGLSGTGKTRILYALFDSKIGENVLNKNAVLYCDIGEHPMPTALQVAERMVFKNEDIILVVDNCAPKEHKELSKICQRPESKIKLITVEYDVREDSPEETRAFCLDPASKESIVKVLHAQKPFISDNTIQLIADFSDGNYRVALSLSSTIEKGEEISGLNDKEIFERLFIQRNEKNGELLRVAEILSLVYSFDSTFEGNELKILSDLLDISKMRILHCISELEERKLLQKRGKWKAILPHAIANRLAKRALKIFPTELLVEVFDIFKSERITYSFCHRLSFLHDSNEAIKIVKRYIDYAISREIYKNIYCNFWVCMNCFASISPADYLEFIEYLLHVERAFFVKNAYRTNTIRNVQDICYESEFFERATEILIDITSEDSSICKEAETALASMFSLLFSGTEAKVEKKVEIIKKLLMSKKKKQIILGEKMLEKALTVRSHGVSFLSKFGSRNRNYRRSFTKQELNDYYKPILKFSIEIVLQDNEKSKRIKQILANQQQQFLNVSLIDMYLEEVEKIISYKDWCEGWIPCLKFLRLNGKNLTPEVLKKIECLRDKLTPKTLAHKIRVFALASRWNDRDFSQYVKSDLNSVTDNVDKYIIYLGEQLVDSNDLLEQLLSELFISSPGSRILQLGMGIARGADNIEEKWNYLLNKYKVISDIKNIELLAGYIKYITNSESLLCEKILDEVSRDERIGKTYLSLQRYANETEFTHQRVLNCLDREDTNLFDCVNLIVDWTGLYQIESDFLELIDKISKKKNTEQIISQMLNMRMYSWESEAKNYDVISDYAISYIRAFPYNNEYLKNDNRSDDICTMLELCFKTKRDYKQDVILLYQQILQRIIDGTVSSSYVTKLISCLVSVCDIELLEIFLPDEYPPISFKITIKGDSEMDYRIEKKEAFRIVGVSKPLEKEIEKNFEIVPGMWGEATQNGTIPKLASLMDSTPQGLLGVSSCNEAVNWRYFIAVASSKAIEGDLEEFIVPASTWAIFSGGGTNISIQELEKRIVTEWLPTSGYEYGNAPDIEVYISSNPEDAKYEVWIPVVRNT